MNATNIYKSTFANVLPTFNGKTGWEAPSNIALIKYWGKKEHQIPANPSISFTLKNCVTKTFVAYEYSAHSSFEVFVDGNRELAFEPKIQQFIDRIIEYCPYLAHLKLIIETHNTFPHSSGIASSASGMAALALCICEIEKQLDKAISDSFLLEKASFIARLGSGSACRSLYATLASWGTHQNLINSSNLIATPFTNFHPIFKNFQDTILLVDKGQKEVGSSDGHNLMFGHPFANKRFEQAHNNLAQFIDILISGNLIEFTKIVESEALTLHAMMMTSMPYFILMKPNTLLIIEKVWQFRKESGLHPIITLDAGANVHLLYPYCEKDAILKFITTNLAQHCQNNAYICDEIGDGPKKLI